MNYIPAYICKNFILFLIGGAVYYLVEVLWRGHSYWEMAVLGGFCFLFLGTLNETFSWERSLLWQSIVGAVGVTLFELAAGIVLNLCLNLSIWDYSGLRFQFLGQISLLYTILWVPLSALAIIFDDYLRYWLFKEEKPHYHLI